MSLFGVYFATNQDEAKELSLHLEQEFQARKFKDGTRELDNSNYFSVFFVGK